MANALPLIVVLAVGVPEIFMALLLGFQLCNEQLTSGQAFIICVLSSLFNYLIRQLGVIFGVHTLLTLIFIITICYLLTRNNLWRIASATVSGVVLIAVIESIEYFIAYNYYFDTICSVSIELWAHFIMAIPKLFILGLLLFLVKRFDFRLISRANFEVNG